jgi:hypothetical protein
METDRPLKIAKAYNSLLGLVCQFTFDGQQLVKTEYFRIENGKEIPCKAPENCNKFQIEINLEHPEKQACLEVKNVETGETAYCLQKVEKMEVTEGLDVVVRASDLCQWKETLAPIGNFSKEDKARFRQTIESTCFPQSNASMKVAFTDRDVLTKVVDEILAGTQSFSSALPTLFKNINSENEFGIERFVMDRIYHLPDLIEGMGLDYLGGINYIAQSEKKDSAGNSIRFENRFKATSDEEAQKLYENIATKQVGIWQKIWLACWSLGNKKGQFTYSCSLTDLMHTAYPLRESYFSSGEKVEFYEHLKSIEQTRFVFSKSIKSRKRKKEQTYSYIIPLIAITHEIREREGNKYPERLTVSLRAFHPEPRNERIYHVGAPIKHKTLELHVEDTQLASWIQARKAQLLTAKFMKIDRNFLIRLAGLAGTDSQNRTVANKRLITKLEHLQEKGILKEAPSFITESMLLRIR